MRTQHLCRLLPRLAASPNAAPTDQPRRCQASCSLPPMKRRLAWPWRPTLSTSTRPGIGTRSRPTPGSSSRCGHAHWQGEEWAAGARASRPVQLLVPHCGFVHAVGAAAARQDTCERVPLTCNGQSTPRLPSSLPPPRTPGWARAVGAPRAGLSRWTSPSSSAPSCTCELGRGAAVVAGAAGAGWEAQGCRAQQLRWCCGAFWCAGRCTIWGDGQGVRLGCAQHSPRPQAPPTCTQTHALSHAQPCTQAREGPFPSAPVPRAAADHHCEADDGQRRGVRRSGTQSRREPGRGLPHVRRPYLPRGPPSVGSLNRKLASGLLRALRPWHRPGPWIRARIMQACQRRATGGASAVCCPEP